MCDLWDRMNNSSDTMRQRIIFHCNHPIIIVCWNFLYLSLSFATTSIITISGFFNLRSSLSYNKIDRFHFAHQLEQSDVESLFAWLIHLFNYLARSSYALSFALYINLEWFDSFLHVRTLHHSINRKSVYDTFQMAVEFCLVILIFQ